MTQTLQEQFSKQTEPDDESPKKLSFWHRCFRVIYDSIRGFIEDDCYAKASALTFYSLLSIVPVLAVLFGIAQGFGFERTLEAEIVEKFSDQYELTQKLIQFAYSWLQSVKGGVIAGFGTVLLLWSVIGLLNNVEAALNAIWKTRIARPYTRKISDYLATLVIAPLFFVTSSSITVFLTTQITQHAKKSLFIELVGPAVLFLLQLLHFFIYLCPIPKCIFEQLLSPE
jgi:membrane protein